MIITSKKGYSIFICGIGGQGIITLSRKIIDSLLSNPYIHNMVLSESRGVSQREGMVSAIIRFYYDNELQTKPEIEIGPFTYIGQANIFIALDLLECLRNLKYLCKDAVAVINDTISYPKCLRETQKHDLDTYIMNLNRIIQDQFPNVEVIKKNFNLEAINQYENVIFATNIIFKELQAKFPTLFLS